MESLVRNQLSRYAYTLSNFLSPERCQQMIDLAETQGFEESKIQTIDGAQVMNKNIRNNERVFFDDLELAHELWERMKHEVPPEKDGWVPVGLNERFRIYKYSPGEIFKYHADGSFVRSEQEHSKYTFMVYLNEEMTGGGTYFDRFTVQPQTGTALVFYHRILHEGQQVTSGLKYVLRSDIMYRLL